VPVLGFILGCLCLPFVACLPPPAWDLGERDTCLPIPGMQGDCLLPGAILQVPASPTSPHGGTPPHCSPAAATALCYCPAAATTCVLCLHHAPQWDTSGLSAAVTATAFPIPHWDGTTTAVAAATTSAHLPPHRLQVGSPPLSCLPPHCLNTCQHLLRMPASDWVRFLRRRQVHHACRSAPLPALFICTALTLPRLDRRVPACLLDCTAPLPRAAACLLTACRSLPGGPPFVSHLRAQVPYRWCCLPGSTVLPH